MRLLADAVEVRYRGLADPVLRGATVEVVRGETVAVLGPSGSGKSTLLAVLGGLVRPTNGTVRVDIDGSAAPRPTDVTTWILQTTNVFSERTALDNVAVAALTLGVSVREAYLVAARHLAAVGLFDRRNSLARHLSGGEVQRVVIARALASRRPFILADEPTGQLDHATTCVVLDALFEAVDESAALIVATHDPTVAERCERVVHIVDGRIVPER